MSMMNCRNYNFFTYWATVSTAARYGSRSSVNSFSPSVYFGHSVSSKNLFWNTVNYRDCVSTGATFLTKACKNKLSEEDSFSIIVMDNNQKGERMKYQRGRKSNNFTLVTCMIAI